MITLGFLIDQLITISNKLWHREEIRHPESGFSDAERLKASDEITQLNRQRNHVIQEIDEYLSASLHNPETHQIFAQLKNYQKK